MAKEEICLKCNKQFSNTMGSCPYCNPPHKRPWIISNIWMVMACTLAACSIIYSIVTKLAHNQSAKPAQSAYSSAVKLNYRSAMLKDIPTGTLLVMSGRMFQLFDNGEAMMHTEKLITSYLNDPIYLEFEERPRVIKDDIVKVFGRYNGTHKYQNALGAEMEVPAIIADYYELLEAKK